MTQQDLGKCEQKLVKHGEAHNESIYQIWTQSNQWFVCKYPEISSNHGRTEEQCTQAPISLQIKGPMYMNWWFEAKNYPEYILLLENQATSINGFV